MRFGPYGGLDNLMNGGHHDHRGTDEQLADQIEDPCMPPMVMVMVIPSGTHGKASTSRRSTRHKGMSGRREEAGRRSGHRRRHARPTLPPGLRPRPGHYKIPRCHHRRANSRWLSPGRIRTIKMHPQSISLQRSGGKAALVRRHHCTDQTPIRPFRSRTEHQWQLKECA